MDPLLYFIATLLSLALIRSMIYNSRRLETIGYALSILFLQQLIDGDEDIFLICPQFPLYVSPKDKEPNPDVTMPDPGAKGVYVDQVLLFPRASQTKGNLKLSQAFRHAHNLRNLNFYHSLHISTLEVPLLEEKKRAPTRHPLDLEDHVRSIRSALLDAQVQVATQAKILFSSPRFATQDLVVLVASSGEYYRLAVLSRGHHVLSTIPTSFDIFALVTNQEEALDDDVVEDLKSQLVLSARTPNERERQRLFSQQQAEKEETLKQNDARQARASARSKRQAELLTEQGLVRKLSQIVINAGEPGPSFSDDWIEAYHGISRSIHVLPFQRYPTFFEPDPKSHETLTTLEKIRNPKNDREIIFTGVIRIGSQTSEKFFQMIRVYLSRLAREERSRRQSVI